MYRFGEFDNTQAHWGMNFIGRRRKRKSIVHIQLFTPEAKDRKGHTLPSKVFWEAFHSIQNGYEKAMKEYQNE